LLVEIVAVTLIALLCRNFQAGKKISVMYDGSAVGKMRR